MVSESMARLIRTSLTCGIPKASRIDCSSSEPVKNGIAPVSGPPTPTRSVNVPPET